jgi:N-acetylmuramoyl-L-alanine amidase CwlA
MVKIIDRQVPGLPKIAWANGKPTVIVAHETGNDNSTVESERNFMSNNWQNAFYHCLAGEDGFYIFHDPDIGGAWGAGPSMHEYAIHVELIRSKTKAGFKKAYKNYVDGIKWLAKKYAIPVTLNKGSSKRGIYTHHYVTKTFGGTTHTDPDAYLAKYGVSISQFAKDLRASKGKATKKKKRAGTPVSGRVESKVNGLRFYNKPSWDDKNVAGHVDKGLGFPVIIKKVKVGNGYQYQVKNSKGATFYITASNKYVKVVGSKSQGGLPDAVYLVRKPYPSGSGVSKVQQALASVYFYPEKGAKDNGVDGIYGPKTANAVKRYQEMHGLAADGIYGPATRRSLLKTMK